MKKFKFRLEKLLDIKKAREREIQHELAHEVAIQNRLIEKQNMLRENIRNQTVQFHDAMSKSLGDIDSLKQFHRYSSYADIVIQRSQEEIDSMQPKINEIRGRLSQAVKERQSIERLKEKKYEEWKYMVKREEEKELDELNMVIFARQQQEDKV